MPVPLALLKMAAMAAGGDPGVVIKLVAHVITSVTGVPDCSISLGSNGDVSTTSVGGSVTPGIGALEWHKDNTGTTGADFDVRATLTAGSAPVGGVLNTWQNLGTLRVWNNVVITNDSTLTLDFRFAGGGAVIKSVPGIQLTSTAI